MKIKISYLLSALALIIAGGLFAFISGHGKVDFALSKREILMRMIGHELLLHSHDKTSRVLPVQKMANNVYQIRFERELSFEGDSLRAIVDRVLKKDELVTEYVVNVRNLKDNAIVFGYMNSPDRESSINPCRERIQPRSRYVIDIKFNEPVSLMKNSPLFAGLPVLAFIGFLFYRGNRIRPDKIIESPEEVIRIGNTLFNIKDKTIIIDEVVTALSVKENRVLEVLANQPNTVIERSRLQKEIWEDEGVIVGRSLDMFISKLRKKLSADPSITLKNIHGKGYKLEC